MARASGIGCALVGGHAPLFLERSEENLSAGIQPLDGSYRVRPIVEGLAYGSSSRVGMAVRRIESSLQRSRRVLRRHARISQLTKRALTPKRRFNPGRSAAFRWWC